MIKRPTSQKHLDKKMRLALEALSISKEEFAKRNHEYCEAYRKWKLANHIKARDNFKNHEKRKLIYDFGYFYELNPDYLGILCRKCHEKVIMDNPYLTYQDLKFILIKHKCYE